MTPKSDIEIVREATQQIKMIRSRGYCKITDTQKDAEEGIDLRLNEILSSLSNLSKQLEAAERMREALDKWYHETDGFDSQQLSDFYFDYQKSKEAK